MSLLLLIPKSLRWSCGGFDCPDGSKYVHFRNNDNARCLHLIIAIFGTNRIAGIRAFVEVAERCSFAEAARRLRRSPTAVTRVIADLEARLGTRLLNRTTRSVSLTEAGERFLAGARRVLADLEKIERAAAGKGSALGGTLASP